MHLLKQAGERFFEILSPRFVKTGFTIVPNMGLGELKFGSLPDEVRRYCGKPNRVGEPDLDWPKETDMSFHYNRADLTISFHTGQVLNDTWKPGDPYRVTCFTSVSRKLTLWGQRLMGMPQDQALSFFAEKGHKNPVKESNEWYPDKAGAHTRIFRFEELNLHLDFYHGKLFIVQWSAPWKSPSGYSFP